MIVNLLYQYEIDRLLYKIELVGKGTHSEDVNDSKIDELDERIDSLQMARDTPGASIRLGLTKSTVTLYLTRLVDFSRYGRFAQTHVYVTLRSAPQLDVVAFESDLAQI